jgi:hypothetical protein
MEGYMKLGVGVLRIGSELSPFHRQPRSTPPGSPKAWEQSALTFASNRTKISKSITASGRFELQFKEICRGKHWRFTTN